MPCGASLKSRIFSLVSVLDSTPRCIQNLLCYHRLIVLVGMCMDRREEQWRRNNPAIYTRHIPKSHAVRLELSNNVMGVVATYGRAKQPIRRAHRIFIGAATVQGHVRIAASWFFSRASRVLAYRENFYRRDAGARVLPKAQSGARLNRKCFPERFSSIGTRIWR